MTTWLIKENDYIEFRDRNSNPLLGKVISVPNSRKANSQPKEMIFVEGESKYYQISSSAIVEVLPNPIPLEFYRSAKKFLALVQDSKIASSDKLLITEQMLGEIISKISTIDENCMTSISDEIEANPLNYSEVIEIVKSNYSGIGYYQSLYGKVTSTEEITADNISVGDSIDDITDIYLDLSHGCFLFDKRKFADAAFHWRESFQNHWGKHATELLLYIHEIAFGNKS